jgi:hypothetical protein
MKASTAKTEAAHGKESNDGKVQGNLTAKKGRRQSPYVPHGKETMHGKGPGHCRGSPLCRADRLVARQRHLCRAFLSLPCANKFFFVFLSILFYLILIYIC